MSLISLIAAIDENRGLGKEKQLLCHLPADLRHFKKMTMGKPVIMGRATYDSIGRPLPGRMNIVLSRQALAIEGVQVVDSLQKALALTEKLPETMIIGGATVFEQTLALASRIYLTIIHHQFAADTFFPVLDESAWYCEQLGSQPADEKNQFAMTFYLYQRK